MQWHSANMHNSENWDHLRYVLAVARSGSVNRAAAELGVNHATVLRHVAAFERDAGAEIFEKSSKGYSVIPGRQALIDAAREVETAMLAVHRRLRGLRVPLHGVVRVTSTDSLCQIVLPPILARLRAELSELHIELLSTNAHLDFARMHADVTVRPTSKLPDDLSGEVAAHLGFCIFSRPGCPADRWLAPGGRLAESGPGRWVSGNIAPRQIVGSADSFMLLKEMAATGAAQALLPCVVGDTDPRLERRGGAVEELDVEIWVASHADLAEVPRIRAVRKRIVSEIGRNAGVLARGGTLSG